jgi:hypothetical protein
MCKKHSQYSCLILQPSNAIYRCLLLQFLDAMYRCELLHLLDALIVEGHVWSFQN